MGSHLDSKSDISSYFRHKSVKFFRLWAIWLAIYLPLDILWYNYSNLSIQWVISWVLHAITSGEGFISWPLWFIFSMAIGCFFLSLACRKRLMTGAIAVFTISTILYLLLYFLPSVNTPQYAVDSGISQYVSIIPSKAERFLFGAIFISAGIIISRIKHDNSVKLKTLTFALTLVIIGCIMAHYNIVLNTLPRGIGITLIGIFLPQIKMQTKSIRQQSMWIYYIHMYCLGFLTLIKLTNQPALYFTGALILSMIIGFVLTTLTRLNVVLPDSETSWW